jgi:hypothetical protein
MLALMKLTSERASYDLRFTIYEVAWPGNPIVNLTPLKKGIFHRKDAKSAKIF